jgi:very-short-patch-repair endonuclease
MAAVLGCGPEAALSHSAAAALWAICPQVPAVIEVSVPLAVRRRGPGLVVHRRSALAAKVTRRRGIPVTTPLCTLLDLAPRLARNELEAAINEATKQGLTDPEALHAALDELGPRPGVAPIREALREFRLTDSELECRFLPLARKAGLGAPETQAHLNGFRVDFYWAELGLVVETDGLRYHRTAAQQTRDRLRDQAHVAAGLTQLRFTHAQVGFQPEQVQATLSAVARRLAT